MFSSQLTVPLFQVALLLILSTLALIFGRLKMAVLINYCFTFYWGFFMNFELFTDQEGLLLNSFTYCYLGFGFLIILLAVLIKSPLMNRFHQRA
jgi:hypothetical protein